MKTRTFFLAALLMVSVVVTAFANEPGNTGLAVLPVKGSKIYKVVYKGEVAGKVKLNLYNSDSELVFTESFKSIEGFILPLNLSSLSAGEYTIELISATGKHVEKINNFPVSPIKFIHVNKIESETGKVLVSVVGDSTATERVSVKIYNREGLVYNDVMSVSGANAQVYNVKALNGPVTFEIVDQAGKTVTANF